jgi:hypothetical protein
MHAKVATIVLALMTTLGVRAQPLPWDGPIVPAVDGSAILDVTCRAGRELPWTGASQKAAHGMAPGKPVWILARDGAFRGTLGRPYCYPGECTEAYAALRLRGPNAARAFAVVPRRLLTSSDRAIRLRKVRTKPGTCPAHPRLQWPAGSCTTWSLGVKGLELDVQTELLAHDEAWDTIRQHVRVRRGATRGTWTLASEAMAEFEPIVMIAGSRDGQPNDRILWFRSTGIIGPARLSVVFSEVKSDAGLRWGTIYQSGGQPCD